MFNCFKHTEIASHCATTGICSSNRRGLGIVAPRARRPAGARLFALRCGCCLDAYAWDAPAKSHVAWTSSKRTGTGTARHFHCALGALWTLRAASRGCTCMCTCTCRPTVPSSLLISLAARGLLLTQPSPYTALTQPSLTQRERPYTALTQLLLSPLLHRLLHSPLAPCPVSCLSPAPERLSAPVALTFRSGT